ncbi:MAG: sulfurtransferase TusA family protein [Candidatus Hodarchaeaceae archaeon]|nr:sulfurtransferase TusA family protein [Candidatus Hodarchaeaceae archaeon]
MLEIIVDHAPAVENVPRSLTNEGHKVLEVRQVGESEWKIVVRKA